jgi:dipeptide transport system ATP-binding protein
MNTPVLEGRDLSRHYRVATGIFGGRGTLRALDGISVTLQQGRTLAVVGESGCGKTTLARLVTLIEPPTAGSITLDGRPATGPQAAPLPELRRLVQMVFQDPYGSLNPRKKVGSIIAEPLVINTRLSAREREETVRAIMDKVGLRPEHYGRYPHMFSGGQRQRIAIARALALRPKLVVADEPVSALDVSIQAQVLNLLMDLQEEFHLAYLFIAHDLSVVRHIADDVLVMYLGRAVEQGPKARVFAAPLHPYTRALLSATPTVDPKLRGEPIVLHGELPSPLAPPPGCPFHVRCPHTRERCRVEVPPPRPMDERMVACHFAGEL